MSRPPIGYRIAQFFARLGTRVGDAWHAVIGPFERLFGRLGEWAFGALDSFEGLESAVIAAIGFVFWPLIAIGRLFGRILPSREGPRGTTGAIGHFFSRLGRRLYQAAERFNLDGIVRAVVWLFTPLWWPIAQLLGFTNAWIATRQTRELLLAAPAALACLPFAYIALQGAVLSQDEIAEHYKVAVREAVDAGEYQLVDLYERKLAQLGVDTRRRDYRTALTLEDDDQLSAAYLRMKRLAPADAPGYPSAHVWIAQRLLSGELTAEEEPLLDDEETKRYQLAEAHLNQLRELGLSGPGLARLSAIAYARTDRLRAAADLLASYALADLPSAALRLRLLAQLRDLPAAKEQARAFLDLLERRGGVTNPDDQDYTAWALAAELLGDASQLEAALKAWREAEPENEQPQRLLAQARRQQVVRMIQDPTASPERAAELLIEAVRLGSPEAWMTAQVTALGSGNRSVGRHADRIWKSLIERRDLPDSLSIALGTAAAGSDRIEAARRLLGRVANGPGEQPVALNNYAWTLIQEPDPDPPAALAAIDRALAIRPRDHRFRETRGQVLVALGRWEEAIEELEYALNGLAEAPDVHLALATAYEALAKPQLAEIHRRQATR